MPFPTDELRDTTIWGRAKRMLGLLWRAARGEKFLVTVASAIKPNQGERAIVGAKPALYVSWRAEWREFWTTDNRSQYPSFGYTVTREAVAREQFDEAKALGFPARLVKREINGPWVTVEEFVPEPK